MAAEIDRQTEDEWIRRIGQGEGFMPTEKKDPVAGMDIGYGHSLTFNGGWGYVNKTLGLDRNNRRLTEDQAKDLCRHDLQNVYKALDNNFPGWRDLDGAGKYVMVDMCYNMGVAKLKQFVKMRAALWEGDYETASKEILNSAYATQTGQRARKNSELIRTGHWYDVDPKRVSKYDKYQTRQKGEAVSNRPLVDGATPKSHDAGQRSPAPKQNSQESESSARTETRTGSVKSKSVPNRALHEQDFIQHVASGQKFYDHPTTITVKGRSVEVIGYGHIITADKAQNNGNAGKHAISKAIRKDVDKTAITQSDAAMICGNDLRKSGGIFDRLDQKYPWWTDLDPKAQAVMVDMCYNQEIGYTDYPQVQGILEALRNKDYTTAVSEMRALNFVDESRNNRVQRNVALMAGIDVQPTIAREGIKGRQALDPLAATPPASPQGHTLTVGDSRIAQQVEQGGPTRGAVRSPQPAQRSAVTSPAPRAATSPAPRVEAPKDKTKKQLHDDSAKAQKILENFNRQHKYKIRDTHSTREGIAEAFEGKDVEVSKIITKALMNPTVVAQKLDLRDSNGKLLRSSRAVVEALGNLDKQRDQEKINTMVQLAKEVQSRRSR